jgi:hypothetical protein
MTEISREILAELEAKIGLSLPDDVRAKYAVSNGFKGPTDCQLLYPAIGGAGDDIVRMNELRQESWFPPRFVALVILGDDGCGNFICFDWNSSEAILWNPRDGEWVQETKKSVTEIWDHVVHWYAELPKPE